MSYEEHRREELRLPQGASVYVMFSLWADSAIGALGGKVRGAALRRLKLFKRDRDMRGKRKSNITWHKADSPFPLRIEGRWPSGEIPDRRQPARCKRADSIYPDNLFREIDTYQRFPRWARNVYTLSISDRREISLVPSKIRKGRFRT